MGKMVALLALLGTLALAAPGRASAGASTDAALALGAFAVFNQIFGAPRIVVPPPAVVYSPPPPPVVYAPPPPPPVVYVPAPPVVVYRPYYYPSYVYVQPGYGHHWAYGRRRHDDDD